MKKILILSIGLILLILICVGAFNGIKIGKIEILSTKGIKNKNVELESEITRANEEISQNYTKKVDTLNSEIKKLKATKEEYESKILSLSESPEVGITQIEKYKIEYLWGIIGNYAKAEGVKLDINIENTSITDTYDIKFQLEGSYIGITNFLYDIENDDELNYKINDFKLEPTTHVSKSKSGTETTQTDTGNLKATFKVESIIINFN